MSLESNIVALAEAVAVDVKALYAGKADKDTLDSLGVELGTLRQEVNKLKILLPPEIGDERYGGFYIGDITLPDGTYMVIMAGEEGESLEKWKLTGTSTPSTTYVDNGKANTLSMVNAGISEHPAGEYCVNYRGGGFDDWYFPAVNEIELAWDNRALLVDLKTGTSQFVSSSESGKAQVRSFSFSSGSRVLRSKITALRVRPVRRIKKE